MKSCNTCKHKEMSVRYLPCRICIDYCLWNMPTEYKEIFIEELEKIKAEMEDKLEPFILGERNLKKDALQILDKRIAELKGE